MKKKWIGIITAAALALSGSGIGSFPVSAEEEAYEEDFFEEDEETDEDLEDDWEDDDVIDDEDDDFEDDDVIDDEDDDFEDDDEVEDDEDEEEDDEDDEDEEEDEEDPDLSGAEPGQIEYVMGGTLQETVLEEEETLPEDPEVTPAPAGDLSVGEEILAGLRAGDVISGFRLVEIRPYDTLNAQAAYFEHEGTGARVLFLANDDIERTFSLNFLTEALDDTGLPHVFEHATLSGSDRYPSENLTMALMSQTYTTYMNGHTFDKMTSYPISSPSEEQLLALADYYIDSCFNPLIMTEESIFDREAWRYQMSSPEDELTLEGTVYTEMQGALTLEAAAEKNFLKDAFPSSRIGYAAGGVPEEIPNLTYEEVLAYHETYYHPSNCVVCLYGQIEDYEAFLDLLDSEFTWYERQEVILEDPAYTPLTESVENTWTFGVDAASGTAGMTDIHYGYVLQELQSGSGEALDLQVLGIILNRPSSPIALRVAKELPNTSYWCTLNEAGPSPVLEFVIRNAEEEDAETFRQIVDEELAQIASEGITDSLAASVGHEAALEQLLIREGEGMDAASLVGSVLYPFALTGDIWQFLDYDQELFRIGEMAADGTFRSLAGQYLGDSAIHVLTVTVPEAGGREAAAEALRQRLAEVKENLSQEEIEDIVARSAAATLQSDDTSAYVEELTALTVEDLPEEVPEYALDERSAEDGVRFLTAETGISDVGAPLLYLDAAGLSQENLRWARLLTELSGYMDTEKRTQEELAALKERYFYGGELNLTAIRENATVHPYLAISWISLGEDLERSYNLAFESLFGLALDEEHTEQLKDAVSSLMVEKRAANQANPISTLYGVGLGREDQLYAFSNYIGNVNYYSFLKDVNGQLETKPGDVLERLTTVREQLRNRTGALAAFAGDPGLFETNTTCAETFLGRLAGTNTVRAAYDFGETPDSYGLVVDSTVNENGYAAGYETLGLDGYHAGMDVVTSLVNDQFLTPLLRDQYGVYTVISGAIDKSGLYELTYRDPNVDETYDVYEEIPELIEGTEFDQGTIDRYILGAYASLAVPEGPLSGAITALQDRIAGLPADRKLTWMEELKAVTPDTVKSFAEVYRKLQQDGVRISAGGSAIRNRADLFDVIDTPFDNEAVQENDA